jgi:bis(5'-adenosyl)-triphosphatase
VAVQDGKAAGQSVPHVHVHILPRIPHDLVNNDDIYEELERWEPQSQRQHQLQGNSNSSGYTTSDPSQPNHHLHVPNDEERKDRTMMEMTTEAAIYRNIAKELLCHPSIATENIPH